MYIVVETQTTNGVTSIVAPVAYDDRNKAEAKFHTVLAAAAVSHVDTHACIVFTDEGFPVLHECYKHNTEGEA